MGIRLSTGQSQIPFKYLAYHRLVCRERPFNRRMIMLVTLFWLALGAFIGWNFPQPEFAKTIQAKILAVFSKK
jgi:hypothetical protein